MFSTSREARRSLTFCVIPVGDVYKRQVIFLAVPEMVEAFADGGVLQCADPQTFEGLGASGFVVDQTEDQLTLASCIGCADQLGDCLLYTSRCV